MELMVILLAFVALVVCWPYKACKHPSTSLKTTRSRWGLGEFERTEEVCDHCGRVL